MPTSSEAMGVQAGRQSTQKRRAIARSSSDPANPRNSSKTLASLDALYDADEVDKPLSRWDKDFEIENAETAPRFWDTRSVVAACISLVVGTIIGIPLGHYLHAIWM